MPIKNIPVVQNAHFVFDDSKYQLHYAANQNLHTCSCNSRCFEDI